MHAHHLIEDIILGELVIVQRELHDLFDATLFEDLVVAGSGSQHDVTDAFALFFDELLPHRVLDVFKQLKGHTAHLIHVVAKKDTIYLFAEQFAVLNGLLIGDEIAQRTHAVAVADVLCTFDVLHGDADLAHTGKTFRAHLSPPQRLQISLQLHLLLPLSPPFGRKTFCVHTNILF